METTTTTHEPLPGLLQRAKELHRTACRENRLLHNTPAAYTMDYQNRLQSFTNAVRERELFLAKCGLTISDLEQPD